MNDRASPPAIADSPLGWALWKHDPATCRSLAASTTDTRLHEVLGAIADCLASTRPVPARLLTDDSGPETSLALLHCVHISCLRDCDGAAAALAAGRMRRLDDPRLAPVLRALIARDEALCADVIDDGAAMVARADRSLAIPALAGDPRLRIGLGAVLVRSLSSQAPDRAEDLLDQLRGESADNLRAAGCDLHGLEAEHRFRTGRLVECIALLADQAADRQTFLDHPLLPFYLAALGAEGRLADLGAWLEDWRVHLDGSDATSAMVRNQRHKLQGICCMHAILRRDFAEARSLLRQRRAGLAPGRDDPPRLLRSALGVELAEGSTRRARALLQRLDPDGSSNDLSLHRCRLHLQEGNLAEAARSFLEAEAAGGMGPRRIDLACSPDLSAPRMIDLLTEVERQRRQTALTRKVRAVTAGGPVLVGHSRAMEEVRESIARFAPLHQPLLISGETGTGKDVIARLIHAASGDPSAPFLPLNCAAVPDSLAESELFGNEVGAFTGAGSARAGIIEAAGSGTVFLDEVTSMPLRLQGVLLRVLETGDFRRVGETRQRQSAARFIFAANEPLERAVDEGRLREDLLYRLRRFVIHAPPLRERIEDIPDLCAHFIRGCTGSDHVRPGPELLRRLQAHSWPGNIRELRNEIERMAVLHPDAALLPASGFVAVEGRAGRAAAATAGDAGLAGLPATRNRRQRILDLLRRRGRLHRAEVVDALGCSPATASRDLQELVNAGLIQRIETSGNLRTSYFTATVAGSPAV
jgi:DNA-binding NtrC family response regulator